jgi:hypothetical protein
MKRSVILLMLAVAPVILLHAQESTPVDMTGSICTSACVAQRAGHATCDATCAGKDKNGDAVFVDDSGKVSKISNPEIVKGKMGQKVKAKCKMSKDNESMQILDVILANAG